jgi:methionyl-tRNA formyltransferase
MSAYLVAGSRPWNRAVFERRKNTLPGEWHFIATVEELTSERLAAIKPRFIFFVHWSRIVPDALLQAFECVAFHMTDVPYGRGGSPLQNLISRGHRETMVTALRMNSELDAGPVYARRPLSLEGSTAEEIYIRATELSFDLIADIVRDEPQPVDQTGEVVRFERRRPAQSELPALADLREVHDFIRMLDAEGYPFAFIEWKGLRLELRASTLYYDRVEARVTITRTSDPE